MGRLIKLLCTFVAYIYNNIVYIYIIAKFCFINIKKNCMYYGKQVTINLFHVLTFFLNNSIIHNAILLEFFFPIE